MDDERVRFLLGAARPHGADTHDPEIAAAAARAAADPALARWLEQERGFDAAIASRMQSLEPPAHLRARIAAGVRLGGRAAPSRRPVLFWSLGLAAALALVAGVVLLAPGGREDAPEVAERAPLREWKEACLAIFADPEFALDLMDESYPPLEAYLRAGGTPVAGALPFREGVVFPVGCKILGWRGQPVSFTCFQTADGRLVHLFVVARGVADESTLARGPAREQVGEFASITWMRDDRIVLVASPMPAAELEGVFAAGLAGRGADATPAVVLGALRQVVDVR